MNSLIKRLAFDAAEPIERLSAQFLKKGALCLSALACLVVSLAFFTVALNDYDWSIAGSEIAALSIGAAYLSFALILFTVTTFGFRQPLDTNSPDTNSAMSASFKSGAEEPIKSGVEEPIKSGAEEPIKSGTKEPIKSGTEEMMLSRSIEMSSPSVGAVAFSRQIDGIVAPIDDVLRSAGLERERATLLAGAAIAKELKPLTSVAFALLAGFFVGRNMRARQKALF
jgi:hypothetical protein